jgi:hypothetical protein
MTAMSLYLWFAGVALTLAAIVSMTSWTVELLFRRRIGVYLSYASIAIIASCAAYLTYSVMTTRCALPESMRGCEWWGENILIASVTFLTIPTLLLSTAMMKKWSDSRNKCIT